VDEIEWESETWNPLCGCDLIEPECDDCYAERRIAEHEQD
jgi:protein gp37